MTYGPQPPAASGESSLPASSGAPSSGTTTHPIRATTCGFPTGEAGATCLYAVYDPVSRRLAVASADHPLPLIVFPDGTSTRVTVQPGHHSASAGCPSRRPELELPEGSLLALYTDGLVANRDRDVDQIGAERLRVLVLQQYFVA
ncbi:MULTISPECIES: PP2C family protein-serine/threonine phosphatase [unclassified Streptomyces]|uniref:PP2C family protein-serine/threonine phosphatase n=1 Tax=unclassified Streptomyces TaxID=2593676 RepID=UPI002E2D10DA|nr:MULTISPECIES: PP2C family protein-serine/threonine phosphatase [unclassified Streptomyces]